MTIEQIELLHNKGLMPDWMYYQQNGKNAMYNYMEQKEKVRKDMEEREKEKVKLEYLTKQEAREVIEKAVADVVKEFNK